MPTQLDFQIQQRLGLPIDQVTRFCQHWHIVELSLFGSVLGDQFHPDSDIDILICFASDTSQGLLTLAKIKYDLEAKTGRTIDIALKKAVEDSENWIRRHEILKTAQVIYEQR